jgi:hypothetical protein
MAIEYVSEINPDGSLVIGATGPYKFVLGDGTPGRFFVEFLHVNRPNVLRRFVIWWLFGWYWEKM